MYRNSLLCLEENDGEWVKFEREKIKREKHTDRKRDRQRETDR